MKEFVLNGAPVKMWAKLIDHKAWLELNNLCSLPFLFHHVALMPDAHGGVGMPIGGVLAARKVVVPNAVGVDIGCGMCAAEGVVGIIPGSQGTRSYIVEGLGNPDSFLSSSHGAGRCMSRTEAVNTLSLEEEIAKMDALNIVHGLRYQNDLDEAASAYKDIDEVMALQSDLVRIKVALSPVAVIKG